MAVKAYVTYGFGEWASATSPERFRKVLSKHMTRATELNGMVGAKALRATIQASTGLAANAQLTAFIKGSSKPLVNHADLFGSQTYEVINPFTVFVGVLRQDEEGFNIAMALHEGFQTTVTPQMRGMFLYLWKVGKGEVPASRLTGRAAELWAARPGAWLPLAPETTVITTKGRPWVTITFADTAFKTLVVNNWNQALEETFKELAGIRSGGGSESKTSKMVGKIARSAKKAARVANKVSKAAKRLGKKASKVASKYSKKGTKLAKRTAKIVSKRVKTTTRSVRRTIKRMK